MLPVARRQKIKEYIQERKSATVTALAALYGVADETIRRDLKILEKEGALMRTYGGAFIQSGVENLVDADLRTNIYVENKRIIAARCAKRIRNGDAVFLDNSTTALYVAEAVQDRRITLLTNSVSIVNLVADKDNISLISTGGFLSRSERAFYGDVAVKSLSEYYVDKAFLSCRSLHMEHGITDSMEHWSRIRQTAVERSRETYIVADFSKFDHTSFIRIGGFENIDAIITDKPLPGEWHQAMAQYDCVIIDHEE